MAAVETARPGALTANVDVAACKIIVDGGHGPGFTCFSHRLGYPIGMDMHEWPYFANNSIFGYDLTLRLKTGNQLSDEPVICIRSEFGILPEDDLLITESGTELLTLQSLPLEYPFGRMEPEGPIVKG